MTTHSQRLTDPAEHDVLLFDDKKTASRVVTATIRHTSSTIYSRTRYRCISDRMFDVSKFVQYETKERSILFSISIIVRSGTAAVRRGAMGFEINN